MKPVHVIGGGLAGSEAAWQDGFAALEKYIAREGHARPPKVYKEDGYPLGAWVKTQCRSYKTGKLSQERIDCLVILPGWAWEGREAA